MEYKHRLGRRDERGWLNLGPIKSKKLKGHVAVQFIEEVLQNYKEAKRYSNAQRTHEHRQKYGKPDMFFGHKNSAKHSQSFYSGVIFDYLRQHLFSGLFDLLSDQEKYKVEQTRLHKKFSRRKMFLFIGKLMILSGLLEVKEDTFDDDIIETIEKKLRPKLRSDKRKKQEIEDHNKNPTDCTIRVQLFHELF